MKHKADERLAEALEASKFRNFFADFSAIEGFITAKSFSPDEDIISTAAPVKYLVYMYEGEALLYHSREYKERIYFKAPWFMGEFSLFRGISSKSRVMAFTLCRCILITLNDESKEILLGDIVFLRCMCKHLANSMVNDVRVAVLPDAVKISGYILENTSGQDFFSLNKNKIKAQLGISREYVTSIVNKLVKNGTLTVIEKSPNKPVIYQIADRTYLEELAQGIESLSKKS